MHIDIGAYLGLTVLKQTTELNVAFSITWVWVMM